ncbi:MAG: hypothetical protein GF401_12655 [Chitinivibrionales bacterium]|nr:hypothetical protein [Chitinivibrionales bacterium]
MRVVTGYPLLLLENQIAYQSDEAEEEDTDSSIPDGFYNLEGEDAQSTETDDDQLANLSQVELEQPVQDLVADESEEPQDSGMKEEYAGEEALAGAETAADSAEVKDVLPEELLPEEPAPEQTVPGTSAPQPPEQEPAKHASAADATPEEQPRQSSPRPVPEPSAYSIPDHVLTPTLAQIYYQQGQIHLSLTIYERLLKRDPDNEKIIDRIEAIKKELAELPPEQQNQRPQQQQPEPRPLPRPASVPKKKQPSRTKKKARERRPLKGVRIKKKVRDNLQTKKKKSS